MLGLVFLRLPTYIRGAMYSFCVVVVRHTEYVQLVRRVLGEYREACVYV
jgi:hypothetical protein